MWVTLSNRFGYSGSRNARPRYTFDREFPFEGRKWRAQLVQAFSVTVSLEGVGEKVICKGCYGGGRFQKRGEMLETLPSVVALRRKRAKEKPNQPKKDKTKIATREILREKPPVDETCAHTLCTTVYLTHTLRLVIFEGVTRTTTLTI